MESGHLNHILASTLLFTWFRKSVFFEEKKNVILVIFLSLGKQQTLKHFRNMCMTIASRYKSC